MLIVVALVTIYFGCWESTKNQVERDVESLSAYRMGGGNSAEYWSPGPFLICLDTNGRPVKVSANGKVISYRCTRTYYVSFTGIGTKFQVPCKSHWWSEPF